MTDTASPIRLAGPRDARSVLRLGEATFVPIGERLGVPKWLRNVDYAGLAYGGRLWVIEADRTIAGMICLIEMSGRLEVYFLAVLPQHQRRGFGRALIEFALNETRRRGLGELSLQTPVQLSDAVAFYRQLGFAEAGRQEVQGLEMLNFWKAVSEPASAATAPRPSAASAHRPTGPRLRG